MQIAADDVLVLPWLRISRSAHLIETPAAPFANHDVLYVYVPMMILVWAAFLVAALMAVRRLLQTSRLGPTGRLPASLAGDR